MANPINPIFDLRQEIDSRARELVDIAHDIPALEPANWSVCTKIKMWLSWFFCCWTPPVGSKTGEDLETLKSRRLELFKPTWANKFYQSAEAFHRSAESKKVNAPAEALQETEKATIAAQQAIVIMRIFSEHAKLVNPGHPQSAVLLQRIRNPIQAVVPAAAHPINRAPPAMAALKAPPPAARLDQSASSALQSAFGPGVPRGNLSGRANPLAPPYSPLLDLAKSSYERGNLLEAINHLNDFLKELKDTPACIEAINLYITVCKELAVDRETRAVYLPQMILILDRAFALKIDSPFFRLTKGNYLMGKRTKISAHEALAEYSKAIEMDSTYFEAYIERGKCQKYLNDQSQAISDFTTTLSLPRLTVMQRNQALILRGDCHLKLRAYHDALRDYSAVLGDQKKLTTAEEIAAFKRRIICYNCLNEWDKAIKEVNSGIKENPENERLIRSCIEIRRSMCIDKIKLMTRQYNVSVSEEDMEKLLDYIEAHKNDPDVKGKHKRISTKDQNANLPRTIEFFPDGTIYIFLNKSPPPVKDNFAQGGDKIVGEGGFKKAKYCLCYYSDEPGRSGELCIRTTEQERDDKMQIRELGFLESLKDVPQVVRSYHTFVFDSKRGYKKREVFMPYYLGGTLDAPMLENGKPLDYDRVVTDFLTTLTGIHAKGIVHCDIKDNNILLTREGVPIIADFGIAYRDEVTDYHWRNQGWGTPGFKAPEVVKDPRTTTYKSDIYSAGVMFNRLLKKVEAQDINLGKALKELIPYMITEDPRNRLSASETREKWGQIKARHNIQSQAVGSPKIPIGPGNAQAAAAAGPAVVGEEPPR